MLDYSQDQIGQEVGDKSSKGESLGAKLVYFNNLITCNWMNKANCEEICEAWGPEFVIAVKESTICIADSPEPKRWQQVNEVLLRHVRIFLVLLHGVRKDETTIHSEGNNSTKHYCPEEESSVQNMPG